MRIPTNFLLSRKSNVENYKEWLGRSGNSIENKKEILEIIISFKLFLLDLNQGPSD